MRPPRDRGVFEASAVQAGASGPAWPLHTGAVPGLPEALGFIHFSFSQRKCLPVACGGHVKTRLKAAPQETGLFGLRTEFSESTCHLS